MEKGRKINSISKARSANRYLVENDANMNRITAGVMPWIMVSIPLVVVLRYLNIFTMSIPHLVIFCAVVSSVAVSTAMVNKASGNIVFNKFFNVIALSLGVFSVALLPHVGIWISFILSTILTLFYIDPVLTLFSAGMNYILMLIAMWVRVANWRNMHYLLGFLGGEQLPVYIGYVLGLTIEFVIVVPLIYYIAKTEEEHIIREDNLMEEVRSDEERYFLAFENSNDIIVDYNYTSDELITFGSFDGHDNVKVGGKKVIKDFLSSLSSGKKIYPNDVEKIKLFMEGRLTGPIEFRYHKNEDEEYRWYSVEGQTVYNEQTGEAERGVGRVKDITAEKREEQILLERVARDRVTNFIQWDVGLRLLSQKTSDEGPGNVASICYIHFSNFSEIADVMGRVFLDAVIERMAEGIRNLTAEDDLKIRISDPSFVVYFSNPTDEVMEIFDSRIKEGLDSLNINKGAGMGLKYTITYFHGLADLMEAMPMEEKFQINSVPDSQKDNPYFGEIIPFVFNVLQRSKELQSAVELTLERISSQFNIDFIHILERDSTTTLESFSCIGEFDKVHRLGCPFLGRKFNVDKDDFDKARKLLEKDDVIRVDHNFFDFLKGDTGDFLDALGTSGIICFIRSEDEIRGCIFYEKSDRDYEWPQELIDALSELSSIIASFILKNMADQASAAKSNFLSSMSHEIRTPMNAIAGFSELILSEKNISDKTRSYAGNIRSSANNLLGIINQILDFSKIESGKFEIIEDNYAMSSLLNDITSIIGIQISEKPIKFTVNIGNHIPEGLYGDVMRIRQIFINILNNSVKYTDKGEITLSVDWRPKNDESGELIAAVKDTGIGIKDEDMPKLFESFMQIDTRRNRGITGTGLGLAVCKNLLNLMGGSIEVESVYGEGSTFSFSIPQRIVDNTDCSFVFGESRVKNEEFSLPFVCPDVRILVVDDNRVNLEVAKGLISQYGASVNLASSGIEALAHLEEDEPYDVIFMDHMMPGMDGIETTVKIREKYTTPVIALTANAIKGVEEEFLNAGMNDYLTKPIELKRLMEVMDKWIPEKKKKRDPKDINEVSDMVNGSSAVRDTNESGNREWLRHLVDIDVNKGLENSLKDLEMYKTLLNSFIMSNKPETFESQLASHDLAAYQISVHALKSSARYIGADELSNLAKHFEDLARDREEEKILDEKEGLETLLSRVLMEIETALQEEEAEGETEAGEDSDQGELLPDEDVRERLQRIVSLLQDMDTDEAETELGEFTELSGVRPEIKKEAKNALKLLRDFDYDEAEECIESALRNMV